jgi:transcriptional regulator with XRE-family HTH domain
MVRTARSHVAEDRPLAVRIGERIRLHRKRCGLTQAALAEGRYTKAYVSALENGMVKPSMAALNYLAGRLEVPITALLGERDTRWARLEADLRLAAGEWAAAADLYEALLETADASARPELLRGLAEANARLDRSEEAVRTASEASTLFEARGQRLDAAWARYWQAFGLYQLEHSEEAGRVLLQIHDALERGEMTDPDLTVRTAIARAMVEGRDDEPERALALLEEARSAAGALDDRRRATFQFALALNYREVGDLEGAVVAGTQSLAHFRTANAELETGQMENELALVYLALDNVDRATEHASAARSIFERLASERWLAHVADTEAQIRLAAGDFDAAIDLARRAVDAARGVDDVKAIVTALLTLARGARQVGALPEARAALEDAADLAREHGRRAQVQTVLGELAAVVAESGDLRRAFELSQEALHAGRATPAGGRRLGAAGAHSHS